jgi:hypothetical protein
MIAFRTDEKAAIFIGIFAFAFGAERQAIHIKSFSVINPSLRETHKIKL